MIPADKSTVAYAEQMQELIGCQVTLQNIKRTRDLPPDETQGVDRNAERLANVIGYLRALQLEYAHNYSASPTASATTMRSRAIALGELLPRVHGSSPLTERRAMKRGAS
jgi:hypothetical protein